MQQRLRNAWAPCLSFPFSVRSVTSVTGTADILLPFIKLVSLALRVTESQSWSSVMDITLLQYIWTISPLESKNLCTIPLVRAVISLFHFFFCCLGKSNRFANVCASLPEASLLWLGVRASTFRGKTKVATRSSVDKSTCHAAPRSTDGCTVRWSFVAQRDFHITLTLISPNLTRQCVSKYPCKLHYADAWLSPVLESKQSF